MSIDPVSALEVINADRPLDHVGDDELDHRQLAMHLARVISKQPLKNGLVIAINSPWGNGKTSVVNMMTELLESLNPSGIPSKAITYDPWLVTGQPNLVVDFFKKLTPGLESTFGREAAKLGESVKNALVRNATVIMKAAHQGASFLEMRGVATIAKILSNVLERPERKKSVQEARDDLRSILAEQKRRLVVIIDDIDRLDPNEMRQVLGMLKSVADLPAIVYVLPVDLDVVRQATKAWNPVHGPSFLDKIVQMRVDLPPPPARTMERFLKKQLDAIHIDSSSTSLFEVGTMRNMAREAFVRTPRSAIHLANAVRMTWTAMPDELNFADVIGIEALRTFSPSTHAYVRDNEALFVASSNDPDEQGWATILQWAEENDKGLIRLLLWQLFFGHRHHPNTKQEDWSPRRRVSNPLGFRLYFGWSIPSDLPSATQVVKFRDGIANGDAVGQILVQLSTRATDSENAQTDCILGAIIDGTIPSDNAPLSAIFSLIHVEEDIVDAASLAERGARSQQLQRAIATLISRRSAAQIDAMLDLIATDANISLDEASRFFQIVRVQIPAVDYQLADSRKLSATIVRWLRQRVAVGDELEHMAKKHELIWLLDSWQLVPSAIELIRAVLDREELALELVLALLPAPRTDPDSDGCDVSRTRSVARSFIAHLTKTSFDPHDYQGLTTTMAALQQARVEASAIARETC